ncbi:MAG: chorismate-binding protein, partial [Gallionellaceae bacterium]|nr:chorismate-binding protein [Gallionellaceae bacterium]
MTEQEFIDLARQGYNRIPVYRQLPADLDTPLSIYLKLANQTYTYLLESVVGGERFGRYSFIGLPARTVLRVHGHFVSVETDGLPVEQSDQDDPLAFIEAFMARYKAAPLPGLPRFPGGLCGYFGYDTVRYIEKRLARSVKPDVLGTPDILLMLTDELAVVDNLSGRLTLIVYADPMQEDAYAKAQLRLGELARQLTRAVTPPRDEPGEAAEAVSEFGQEAYMQAVEKAKRYIRDGDIMQVVPSQRMSRPFHAHPLSLYRALRGVNPSPYMFYFDMGNFHVVGASPEILTRLEGDMVTVRPIAGTRPRGNTREEDLALEHELLADPKELAEHLMLVDLGRNDIGRVAQTGSVKVTEKMVIERYSHVMHIVSNVEGKLRDGLTAMDVLRATFPAGTVSGAPKVRAMEIIDELEPTKRGIYAGAVGYLG